MERDILSKSRGLFRKGDRHVPLVGFGFVRDHQDRFPVAPMCRVLGVSCSGFYAWRKRPPSARAVRDAALTELIKASHRRSDGTYGAPRLVEDLLREDGEQVSRQHVARLMREAKIVGVHRRRGVRTTRRGADVPWMKWD